MHSCVQLGPLKVIQQRWLALARLPGVSSECESEPGSDEAPRTNVCTGRDTGAGPHRHTHTRAYKRTHTGMQTKTYTHTHTHTRTHTQSVAGLRLLCSAPSGDMLGCNSALAPRAALTEASSCVHIYHSLSTFTLMAVSLHVYI